VYGSFVKATISHGPRTHRQRRLLPDLGLPDSVPPPTRLSSTSASWANSWDQQQSLSSSALQSLLAGSSIWDLQPSLVQSSVWEEESLQLLGSSELRSGRQPERLRPLGGAEPRSSAAASEQRSSNKATLPTTTTTTATKHLQGGSGHRGSAAAEAQDAPPASARTSGSVLPGGTQGLSPRQAAQEAFLVGFSPRAAAWGKVWTKPLEDPPKEETDDRKADDEEAGYFDDDVVYKPQKRRSRPRKYSPKGHTADLLARSLSSKLVHSHREHTRQMRNRIRAFDRRMQKTSGQSLLLANASDDDELDEALQAPGIVKPAGGAPAKGKGKGKVSKNVEEEEEEELEFRVVAWSSQRKSAQAVSLLRHNGCWQTEVSRVKREHVTLELARDAVVCSVHIALVLASASPKQCEILCSTISMEGPWDLAWEFQVPELSQDRCSSFRSRSDRNDVVDEPPAARWWRLVIVENYGSHASIALGGPLKLYGNQVLQEQERRRTRNSKVSFLNNLGQCYGGMLGKPQDREINRIARTYMLTIDFVKDLNEEFEALDTDLDCVISEEEFKVWIGTFTPEGQSPKARVTALDIWWKFVDLDHNGMVDFEEFVVFYSYIFERSDRSRQLIGDFLFAERH